MSAVASTLSLRARSLVLSCIPRCETTFSRRSLLQVRNVASKAPRKMLHSPSSASVKGIIDSIHVPRYSNPGQKRAFASTGASVASPSSKVSRVYVALGSNVGNRMDMIEQACVALSSDPDITIKRTSCLYETEPMYVENQARFLNGACEVSESLWTPLCTLIEKHRSRPHCSLLSFWIGYKELRIRLAE